MLVIAAVVPAPPLLVPEVASGAASELDDVRAAIEQAFDAVTGAAVDALVCVGSAGETVHYPGGSFGSLRGFGVDIDVVLAGDPTPSVDASMPPSLSVLAWLVARFGGASEVVGQSIAVDATPDDARRLGATLVAGERRVGLIVAGDGSAALTEKSPGYFVDGAVDWQARVGRALASADLETLTALTPEEGDRFVAAGRAPWQVLAGAAQGQQWRGGLLSDSAPYGVGYPVAVWEQEPT